MEQLYEGIGTMLGLVGLGVLLDLILQSREGISKIIRSFKGKQ